MRASPARAGVVALRVIRQLKRDRRTIGLIVFAPIVLMILFGYALSGDMSGVAPGAGGRRRPCCPAGTHRVHPGLRYPLPGLAVGCREANNRRTAGRGGGHAAGRGAGFAGCQQPADLGSHCGGSAGGVSRKGKGRTAESTGKRPSSRATSSATTWR